MIKTTLGNLFNSTPILKELIKKEFKASTAYNIMKLCKASDEEWHNVTEIKNKLAVKLYEKGKPTQEEFDAATKEMNDLLDKEIEVNCSPISINELNDISITPELLEKMSFFIKEE